MRKLWWFVRRSAKGALCRLGLGSLLVEYCDDCGRRVSLYWWADNGLWERLTGHATPRGDNASGILCTGCFDRRATREGLLLRWRPEVVSEYGAPIAPATPGAS